MFVDFMLGVWEENRGRDAIVWRGQSYSYGWLLDRFSEWRESLAAEGAEPGAVVVLEADFSPNSVALFLALAERGCVLVPLTESVGRKKSEFIRTAQGEVSFEIDADDRVRVGRLPHTASHPLYDELRRRGHPGLVLFSSGSTGESKAAVHDLVPLLEKFRARRQSLRTISFLLYDHIGGVNTMLHTLANGGCLVTVAERTPDGVLGAVEKFGVELLPTSPTFLNLVLLGEAYKRHDLSSLQTITYGTEPMPAHTLKRCRELFPSVRLQQTYGLSELGILRSKSKDSDSLWVKIGGEGFETRVVEGVLQIKARSAMLGYLNAPSPFTEDGWFNTGDAVEADGEYLRILGRKSEIINVGGEKVYPAEVESVIQELAAVAEVTVYGERNPITGSIVCADITPASALDEAGTKRLVADVKRHCRGRLRGYQAPLRVNVVGATQHTGRFKKVRR
ncbi:MAG TPA: fatty acid--CoA ligase family protein [Pyrinomonadaceae bacterium]|jgi:acyl-CoA synthetase (AMP-forming)/AMP-acid ligase II|nr:fatty acid--CoA ligase family protein [Pyrinomonadaceae bacterium]